MPGGYTHIASAPNLNVVIGDPRHAIPYGERPLVATNMTLPAMSHFTFPFGIRKPSLVLVSVYCQGVLQTLSVRAEGIGVVMVLLCLAKCCVATRGQLANT